jgi:hypothetical protein
VPEELERSVIVLSYREWAWWNRKPSPIKCLTTPNI